MFTDKKLLKNEERAMFALRWLYRQYGYLPYKMSRFEEYDLYVRCKDFLVSDRIITFSGRNGQLMAMKPDVTLSIIKNAPDEAGAVQKVYYNENVFRMDKGTGDYQEILQTGLECVGDLTDYEITEVVLLATKSLAQLGGNFILNLSHMGLVSRVLADSGLPKSVAARAMECLRQKNRHELTALCRDADADPKKLLALLDFCGAADTVLPGLEAAIGGSAALEELKAICGILNQQGFGGNVRLDFSVGNDMKYYNGVVFRGYLQGIPTSILTGGQYDRLLTQMGHRGKAIGFAINVDLLERLEEKPTGFDVDAVLLYSPEDAPADIAAAAGKIGRDGSVLVAREKPASRRWRRLWKLEGKEAVLLEDNG